MPVDWESYEAVEQSKSSPVDWQNFEPVEDKPRGASGTWEEVPTAEAPDWKAIEANYNRIYQPPTEPDATLGATLRESLAAKGTVMGIPAQALALVPRPTAQQVQDAADFVTNPSDLGAPSRPPGEAAKIAAGVLNVGRGIGEGFVSPLGLATLGAGALPAAAQRGVSAAFAADMASQIPEQARRAGEASVTGDTQEQVEAFGNLVATPAMTAAIGLHAVAPRIPPEIQRAVDRGVDAGLNKSAAAALKAAERKPIEIETKVEPLKEGVPNAKTVRENQGSVRAEGREPEVVQDQGSQNLQQPAPEPSQPVGTQAGQESPVLLTAPEVIKSIVELPDEAAGKLKQKEAVEAGMKLTPEDVPALEAARDQAAAEGYAALESNDNAKSKAAMGRNIYFSGLIEGANRKGPNYDYLTKTKATAEAEQHTAQPIPERQAPVAEQGVAPIEGELAAMGAATPGSFPTPPSRAAQLFQNLTKPLAKARAAASQLWQSRNVRDAMAFTRDAGENEAALFGRQAANEVRNAVKREFPQELAKAEDALTAVIEAGGDAEQLAANKAKLEASTAGSAKWRKRAMEAHDFALYNLDKLRPIAEQYRGLTDAQVAAEQGAGVDTLKRDRYVMHAQDSEDPSLFGRGGGGEPSGFRKNRTYESFADSIAAGVDPKTINAVDLLDTRLRNGQRLINNRAWVEGLRSMKDPRTGASIAENPVTVTRADGSTYQQAPDGYKIEGLGRQPIAIKNGYEGIFTALTDPSQFSKNAVGRGFLTANGTGKSINLLFDTFHLGRLAFWESLIKGLGVKTFEAPLPSYRKGATLLDFSVPEIQKMAANGEVPKQWLPELVKNKQRLDTLVENGYNVGRVSDALYQDLIHHIPVVGHFNKWLFEKFQRGAMAEVGLLEFERRKTARPEESDAQIARAVAKDLNTRFGNLGRQGVFKSRTAQDLARTIFLAPQWNEGLIRSELGAVKQLGELALDTAHGKRVFSGVLLRSVGAMALGQFAANQLINYYTRGHPTWENPEEGFGAKLSAWIPDKIGNGPGFFLHPLGLAAETTHLLMQKYEKTGDSAKVLNQYARSRSSAAMRPVLTFLTREDELGRKIKPDNIWGKIVNSAIPAPIGGSAIVQGAKEAITKEPSESFPGQFQKQMMASVGVKTEQAPGAQSRIRTLASDFNKAKGIEPKAEFYEGDYVPLLKALQIGNQTDAKAAMEELRKIKTPQQLQVYGKQMAQRPFTGNKAREVEFRRGLSPVQQKAYEEALAERRRIQQEFFRLLRSP